MPSIAHAFLLTLAACSSPREPARVEATAAPTVSAAPAVPPYVPSGETLAAIDRDDASARADLARFAAAPPTHAGRVIYEAAVWVHSRSGVTLGHHLATSGIDASHPDVAETLLVATERALSMRVPGIGAAAFSAWLEPRPRGQELPARARAASLTLLTHLREVDMGDSLVRATLERDPHHGALATAAAEGMLAPDILDMVERHAGVEPRPEWCGALVRDLPRLATLGDLEDAAVRARIVRAMVTIAGVSEQDATRQIEGARTSLNADWGE